MTKIAIQPSGSGTGTFTIAAPNSNTNRTFTLPDATGEVLTDQSNIEAQVKTATNTTGSAPIYAARAWVNFNGTGTVAIRASGNVSSITDNGTGDYTVNFATAMPDTNYSAIFGSAMVITGRGAVLQGENTSNPLRTTSALRVLSVAMSTGSSDANPQDSDNFCMAIFR